MSGELETSLTSAVAGSASSATLADGTVRDDARNVAGELAIPRPNAHRDDTDVTGHRVTELTLERQAA